MKVLRVLFHGFDTDSPVLAGRLAYRERRGYFEYAPEFLQRGVNLSPLNLQWEPALQQAPIDPFNGLHGVFSDSLPDGWGLYLMDKVFRQNQMDPASITPIDRLAYVGTRTLGALSYEPDEGARFEAVPCAALSLSVVGREATDLYQGSVHDVMAHHAVHGTPSAGARPKILIGLDGDAAITGSGNLPTGYSHWLAKFPTGQTDEQKSEGAIEYIYAELARRAGINMAPSRLIPGDNGNAYFLSRRFDRKPDNRRQHVHSVAGLVHADFRLPDFDYAELLKLCGFLTKSHAEKTELFRRMVFNVMSGNRDDHSKNFAFMLTDNGEWINTPAFDITWNTSVAGEHSMTLNGKGKHILLDDVLQLARNASIDRNAALRIVDETASTLGRWASLARQYAVPTDQVQDIQRYLTRQQAALTPRLI